jgi:hypothetical protein
MPIRITRDCRVAWDHGVADFRAGDEIPDGPLADYLLATGAPVEQPKTRKPRAAKAAEAQTPDE